MLDKLKQKYPDKDITLICGSYFDVNFGEKTFDTVISCQTMHHFSREDKIGLYRKILNALNSNGAYIEVDYMVMSRQSKMNCEPKT
jgi:tRNA (cmo5U34)-methyltransferase